MAKWARVISIHHHMEIFLSNIHASSLIRYLSGPIRFNNYFFYTKNIKGIREHPQKVVNSMLLCGYHKTSQDKVNYRTYERAFQCCEQISTELFALLHGIPIYTCIHKSNECKVNLNRPSSPFHGAASLATSKHSCLSFRAGGGGASA